jgi:hypothetical protein
MMHMKRDDEHIDGRTLLIEGIERTFNLHDGLLRLGEIDITAIRKAVHQSYEKIWLTECEKTTIKYNA